MKKYYLIFFFSFFIYFIADAKCPADDKVCKSTQAALNFNSKVHGGNKKVTFQVVDYKKMTTRVGCTNGSYTNPVKTTCTELLSTIEESKAKGFAVNETGKKCEPVITTSTSEITECSSYISSWDSSWSDCTIIGAWSPNGTIQCTQRNDPTPNYSSCGTQTCETTYSDGIETSTSCTSCTGCPDDENAPALTDTKTIAMNLQTPTTTCNGNLYANNSDSCSININVQASTNQSQNISGWGSSGKINAIVDMSGQKSDRVYNTGVALNFSGVTSGGISSSTTSKDFTITLNGIKSRAPFVGTGQVKFFIGGVPMELKNIPYHFKKPFIGDIKVWSDISQKWDGKMTLGTQQLYKLGLVPKSNLTWESLNQYQISNFEKDISPFGIDLEVQQVSLSGATMSSKNGAIFNARINTSSGAKGLNPTPGLQVKLPILSYSLGGENVKYYLSQLDIGDDASPIKVLGSTFLGVKILGSIQSQGKGQLTGQKSNISDLSQLDLRTNIRKSAYENIKNMTSGQILNGIKFVTGDVTISGDQNFETLVVKDGNVIINGDLNTSGKKLGIVVLKDNYNIHSDYLGKGNIYVTPNVKYISSLIYADGGLISVDQSQNVFLQDSTTRTAVLKKQLIIKGVLFTRNTIGGAILAGGKYILPGGTKVDAFDKAMIYDLNFIRRNADGCDQNNDGKCMSIGEYENPVVIIYDSGLQADPPKLFK